MSSEVARQLYRTWFGQLLCFGTIFESLSDEYTTTGISEFASPASFSEPMDGAVGLVGDLVTMELTRKSGSIADHCQGVRESLLTMIHGEDARRFQLLLPGLENILDKFILWAGNMGALHPPHSRMSLESRLAGSPEVRHQISELLEDLYGAVQDCKTTRNISAADFPLIKHTGSGNIMFRR